MSDRENLTKRTIPHMTLARPDETPTPGTEGEITPRDNATTRFSFTGAVIVTGGTGTLGTAVCKALLEQGCTGLSIFDLDVASPPAIALLSSLRDSHPDVFIAAHQVDVTDEEAVERAVDEAARLHGSGGDGSSSSSSSSSVSNGGRIDALVSAAGIVGCVHALDLSAADLRRIIDVNTIGAFTCARAAARKMIVGGRGGRIVFVASISAHRVNFPQPQVGYNVSKGALLMLSKSLAAEWARYGIRVNTVSPGYLDTVLNHGPGLAEARDTWCARNPTGRMGRVEEVAAMVAVLVSRAGSYISGADMVVDGGGMVF